MNFAFLQKTLSTAEAAECAEDNRKSNSEVFSPLRLPQRASASSAVKRFQPLIAAALLAVGLVSCTSEKKETAAAPETIPNVALVTAQSASLPDLIEAVGTVHAAETAQVSAQMMGNVLAVNVHEGDHVRRGQMLAVIDDTQPRAGLDRANAGVTTAQQGAAAADADATLAEATLKRYQALFDRKSVSPQEFDEVKARNQAAQARREMARSGQAQANAALLQAKATLSYTRINAPFDGVVTERRVDPGTLAAPGMPLLIIEAGGRFRLEATVDETALSLVKLGESAAVAIDALQPQQAQNRHSLGTPDSEPLEGRVVQIVPAADPSSRTFVVKVELPANAGVRSGLFGRASFPRGQRDSLVVPRSAVINRGQLQGVYVVGTDKVANLRYVTLGKMAGGNVEVLSGIQPGESLVASPGDREFGGKRIE